MIFVISDLPRSITYLLKPITWDIEKGYKDLIINCIKFCKKFKKKFVFARKTMEHYTQMIKSFKKKLNKSGIIF